MNTAYDIDQWIIRLSNHGSLCTCSFNKSTTEEKFCIWPELRIRSAPIAVMEKADSSFLP